MAEINLTGADIGSPSKQGATKEIVGGYEIVAGGADIWGSTDQFHFAYLKHTGDFDFTIRMESLSMADLYTKSGLMARESLDAGSEHIFLLVFPNNSPRNKNNGGYEFQYREATDGECVAIYPPDYTTEPPEFPVNFPYTWLRLKRSGDDFEALYSADGESWTLFAKHTLKLSPSLYLGFAVTSHNENETVTATFRDITLG
jgi:regulation of enolase protein 1 (concanavalin A-like superfamily)